MAETRHLHMRSDQELIRLSKQYTGVAKELVMRELRARFNGGELKNTLPKEVLRALKEK